MHISRIASCNAHTGKYNIPTGPGGNVASGQLSAADSSDIIDWAGKHDCML